MTLIGRSHSSFVIRHSSASFCCMCLRPKDEPESEPESKMASADNHVKEKSSNDSGKVIELVSDDKLNELINKLESLISINNKSHNLLCKKMEAVIVKCEENNKRTLKQTQEWMRSNQRAFQRAVKNLFEQQQKFFNDLKDDLGSLGLLKLDSTLFDSLSDSDHRDEDLLNIEPYTVIQPYQMNVDNYYDMNLKGKLLNGIYNYGFEKPSSFEQSIFLSCIQGRDIVAQVRSETDINAIFSIYILQSIDTNINECQALLLVPNRESALQIHKEVNAVGHFMKVQCDTCIDGTEIQEDIRKLRAGAHVVVGIPDHILDIMKQEELLENIKLIVLYEVDKMLSSSYKKDKIYDIFKFVTPKVQVLFVSTTMSTEFIDTSMRIMKDPTYIIDYKNRWLLENIKQFYVCIKKELRFDALHEIYDVLSIPQSIIFCNTSEKVHWLAKKMNDKHFTVSAWHDGMKQRELDIIIRQFRTGSSRVLITTDSIALSIKQVFLTINYDLPSNMNDYINRLRHCCLVGRKSVIINFVTTDNDKITLRNIEEYYNTSIDQMPMDFANVI